MCDAKRPPILTPEMLGARRPTWRAGVAAAAVAVLLSATPVSTFSPGLALPGIARASSPALTRPLRPMSVCGALRMQAGKEGKGGGEGRFLSAAVGAAMAASIVFGPVAPVEGAAAFSDLGSATSVVGEDSAIHLAKMSWLDETASIDELVKGGLSGKDNEEGPIAARKVLSSFLSMHHEEKGEKITPYSVAKYLTTMAAIWAPSTLALRYVQGRDKGWTGPLRRSRNKTWVVVALVCSVPLAILVSGMATAHADWPLIYTLLSTLVVWSPAAALYLLTRVIDSLRAADAGYDLVDRR